MKRIPSLFTPIFLLFSVYSPCQSLRDRIQERRADKVIKEQEKSQAPDYSNLFFWAAHPDKKDMSDSVPASLASEKREELADVFFLHPTSYTKDIRNAMWNADLYDTSLNNATDSRIILNQASVFNNCCRVYAPRYRQAHLKAYMMPRSEASQKAFDLAYEDLRNAFQYYLDHFNHGRPIVIASHSQGAMHAVRLLKEFFDGKPLQKQLVCAYIVGWQIKNEDFSQLKVGETPDATGCFVGWRSYKYGEENFLTKNENGNSICVNPITWTTSTAESTKEQHKGTLGRDFNKIIPHLITASISPESKILWVRLPDAVEDQFGKLKNYHVADYNLFFMDIRENVMTRVKAFLEKSK